VKEGDVVEVVPDRIGKRGEAEGEAGGRRVRVRGGLPGERARVRILHVSKGGPVAAGKWLEAVEPHPARREPPCPIHERCGGCGLQQVEPGPALAMKVAQARALLPQVEEWRPPLTSPRSLHYRAKTFLLAVPSRGGLRFGARPPRGRKLVDTSGCVVLRPEIEAVAAHVRAELTDAGVRTVLIRGNRAGDVQVTLVYRERRPKFPRLPVAALFLQRHDEPGNRVCSDRPEDRVFGEPVVELFDGLEAEVPPTAFMQANPDVAEALYREAAKALTGDRLADLYCGGGVAGLLALRARPHARLHGIDRSPRSIDAARRNAARNGLAARCRFEPIRAEEAAGDWDSVLLNPPRAGCHASVLDAVARSRARRAVYLSCNPATLARDIDRLGWRATWARPADMLPQTPHLEVLAVLDRR